MDPTRLVPEPAGGEKRQQAIQDAKDMYSHTLRTCQKLNIPVPPYDFLELIGKGGSGRVYKCRDRNTGDLVAVKTLDTDAIDYNTHFTDKDNTIRDFQKEVAALQKLKDSQARNINIIHDAIEVGAQLWIISDYCTGGSVRTLMRALPPGQAGLEEQFIIPIARELLVALEALHSLQILHRDIKATNVYITETGDLQLGDYGVAAFADEHTNKRRTILGTPHWMAPEMLMPTSGNELSGGYGTEIDIWAFGCTVFEMATGAPPNARIAQNNLDRALLQAPRLEGEQYSAGLRDFIAFCLQSDPRQRSTAAALLEHPYVANTQRRYPMSSLIKLIEKYKLWEYGGGIRQSLFMQGGAPSIPSLEGQDFVEEDHGEDDWNFSTSESFNTDFARRYSHMIGSEPDLSFHLDEPFGFNDPPAPEYGPPPIDTTGLSNFEKLQAEWSEQRANRGGESLARLYRMSAAEYQLHTPVDDTPKKAPEDLPLRPLTQDSEEQESFVDLDEAEQFDPAAPFNFDFVDATTLKARKSRQMSSHDEEDEEDLQYGRSEIELDKRATMEWTFPSTSKKVSPKRATMDWTFASARVAEPGENDVAMDLPPPGDGNPPPAFRPALKHTQTMPLGEAGDYIHPNRPLRSGPATSPIRDSMGSMIDLDMGMVDDVEATRPGTAISTTGSQFSDMTSGNPFDLEDDAHQNELDRNRFSYHKQWQSEGGQVDRHSRRSIPMHTRGNSLSSTDNELDRLSNGLTYQMPNPGGLMKASASDTKESIDLDSWPNFDQPGVEQVTSSDSDVVHIRQPSATISHTNGHGHKGRGTITFPRFTAPHPDTLGEETSVQIVEAELERLFSEFGEGLVATQAAFEQHIGLKGDDSASESEGTYDRGAFD